jgi:enoyl-[acyl-carrier protein] reductase II
MITTPPASFGITYPLFQGPWPGLPRDLAAAVSGGGGLGIISSMNAEPASLREEIKSGAP